MTARAVAALPGPAVGYGLSQSPDLSFYIATPGGAVFVNQYTGEVLGLRDAPTWLNRVHQFHLRLLAGNTGKTIVSWAGVLMVLLTLSGLYLWWPVKRVSINRSLGGRRVWFDLHNAVGVFSFAFVFLLSLTGVVIGFERVTTPAIYRLTSSQPYPRDVPVTPLPGARRISPDEALAIAMRRLPGAAPVDISVPDSTDAYRVALRYPESFG